MASTDDWGVFILLIVLIFCGIGIKVAYDQREARLAWMTSVEAQLQTGDHRMTTAETDIKDLKEISYTDFVTKDDLDSAILSFNVSSSQQTYRQVAGCYGVVPQGNETFPLLCSKTFTWD